MAEWLIEEGIAERRALLVDAGIARAAKLIWPGELVAGSRHTAKLTSKQSGNRRGIVKVESGQEVLVDHLPDEITEGSKLNLHVVRASIAERGRLKRAVGRCVEAAPQRQEDTSDSVWATSKLVHDFAQGLWEEVWHAASSGSLAFAGGEIVCSTTPAMTVIDIDGDLPQRELSLAAIPAIVQAIRWFDLGGSIGIDFPTIPSKKERRMVDEALAQALGDWPHERTAMNGFGFVQLIARLEGPSLLHRFASSRVGACARYAVRLAERAEGAGVTLLTVHPALKAKLKPEWLEELRRRTGREVRIET